MNIQKVWENWAENENFSGVFSLSQKQEILFQKSCGNRNKNENLANTPSTAFGIASGTKLFTALGISILIDAKKLNLTTTLGTVLPYNLGTINPNITIQQLLTHTSGIGDYLDESSPNVEENILNLYNTYPVYLWENLPYYLPIITSIPQKFNAGEQYSYCNSGYILLGLVIESISKKTYQEFITETIISPLNLIHTGFYYTNNLPPNTALGYIWEPKLKAWNTNIFKIPIRGGSDGGLYTCAEDITTVWQALFLHKILSTQMLNLFLACHVERPQNKSIGLGIYQISLPNQTSYYSVGSDFGVSFFTAYFPKQKIVATALCNTELDIFSLLNALWVEFS